MQPSPDPLPTVRLPVRNDKSHDVTLVLEPWGEEVMLPSGATMTVMVRGRHAGEVELVWGQQDVTFFAAPGTTVEVEDAQGVQVTEIDIPFPELPAGMSTRSFVSRVLKGEPES